MLAMTRFPLLKHIRISDYQLYPGIDGGGIDRGLPGGATIIAGVNGLGKTTLLNMIFRVLSGPCDWRVMDGEDDIGNIKHELVRWRHPSYFRDRVRNGAAGALVTAVVGFGATTVVVSRSLQDFSVQGLSVDGSALLPSEERYRDAVLAASGVDSITGITTSAKS
jgi:hypothetical protein